MYENIQRIIDAYENLCNKYGLSIRDGVDGRISTNQWKEIASEMGFDQFYAKQGEFDKPSKGWITTTHSFGYAVTKDVDEFLNLLLEECETMKTDYIEEGETSKSCMYLDPGEEVDTNHILSTKGSIIDIALKIPPEYLESVLPIAFMRDILRDKNFPCYHRGMANFSEFYRRCGNAVLNS